MKSVGKKYEVNDELMKNLDEGKIKWSDLDSETEAAAGAYLDKLDTSAPESPDAQTIQPEAEIRQDEPAKPPKGFVEGSRFKEKADAASDFENKWKSEQRIRLELEAKLKEKEREPIQAPTLDKVWTDEAQIDLHTKFAELQRKVESFEGERKQTLEEARAEKMSAQNETEMQMLRSNPLFKKAIPAEGSLDQIEKVYADFFWATGATAEDATPVKKYFTDPAFRKELESKGVKAPENFEAINTVLQVKALRDKYRQVDPDFKMTDAYVSFMAKNNKLPSMFVEERLKGAAEVADKLHGIANETVTMQPGLTSGATQDSWSDVQMLTWLNKNPHPKTKDEKATFARIEAILDQRAAQAQGY